MNLLLRNLFSRYQTEEADDLGGGGSRGDDFLPDDDAAAPATDDAAAPATDDDEAAVARDAQGRFAKKDDEAEQNPEGEKAPEKKKIMIPKARFDEVRLKAREREAALQAQIDAMTKAATREAQGVDVAKINDHIEALEEQYQQQLADGNTAKAREIMREIRLNERKIVEIETSSKSAQAQELAVEQFKLDSLISKLEADFPVLNPSDDNYSQEIVDEVMVLREGFERGGLSSSQALAKAVKYVLREPQQQEEAPAKRGLSKDDAAGKGDRRKEQLGKNVDAARRTPPRIDDLGMDSGKKGGGIDTENVGRMTEEEFAALPESTKARLRGDIWDATST